MMDSSERRRYFRIDTEIGLRYRSLTEAEALDFQSGRLPLEDNEIDNIDRQIAVLLEAVRIQQSQTAEILQLLNQKISIALGQKATEGPSMFYPTGVNISACGVAFESNGAMKTGEPLLLDIQLNDTGLRFQVLGRIVASDKNVARNGGQVYLTRVDFEHIDDASQELLVQHVVRQQGRLLKARRESKIQE